MSRDESLSTPYLSEEKTQWRTRLSLTLAEEEILNLVLFPPNTPSLSNETVHKAHGWFTSIRLFLGRLNRLLAPYRRAFLPAIFSLFGLSYGISFSVDLFVVLKATFAPSNPTAEEQRLGYGFWKRSLQRFKKSILEGNRPYRMLNDAVWFTINITTFCLAGPLYILLNPILNIIGFGFDTTHEFFWFGRNLQKYTAVINKLSTELNNTETALRETPPENLKYSSPLQNDLEGLQLTLTSLQKKRSTITHRQIYTAIFTAIIFVGMALIFFPPTSLPGAVIIGSAIAFGAGSLFTGLGRRLYWTAEEHFPSLWRAFKKRFNDNSPPPTTSCTQTLIKFQTPDEYKLSISATSPIPSPPIAPTTNQDTPRVSPDPIRPPERPRSPTQSPLVTYSVLNSSPSTLRKTIYTQPGRRASAAT